jgi:hypothetical protein
MFYPLPPRQPPEGANIPEDIGTWIAELPMVNSEQTLRQIYALVRDINRVSLAPARRMTLLAALEVPAAIAVAEVAARIEALATAPAGADMERVDLALGLCQGLAVGYRCLLPVDLEPDPRVGPTGEYRQRAFSRALGHLCEGLRLCYLASLKPHPKIWGRLVALYAYAEELGLTESPGPDGAPTPASLVKRLLLLRACAPHTLRPREQTQLWTQLGRLTDQVRLGRRTYGLDEGQVCLMDGGPGRLLVLEIADLLGTLRHALTRPQSPAQELYPEEVDLGGGLALPRTQAELLAARLGVPSRRRGSRTVDDSPLEGIVGLSNIHTILSAEAGDGDGAGRSRSRGPSAMRAQGRGHLGGEFILADGVLIRPAAAAVGKLSQRQFTVVNHSALGYRLVGLRDRSWAMGIGEVIALREPGGRRWMLGVIQWLSGTREQFQLGVRLLAPAAAPATVLEIGGRELPAPCLLLYRSLEAPLPDRLLGNRFTEWALEHLLVRFRRQYLRIVPAMAGELAHGMALYPIRGLEVLTRRGGAWTESGLGAVDPG